MAPEDLVTEDLGVVFRGAEHPLFFRPDNEGCYRPLGDGSFTFLPIAPDHGGFRDKVSDHGRSRDKFRDRNNSEETLEIVLV
jgi:hypothetical protein